ncbi:MAG: class I SAM-dependent methyltransferase [Candidatus Nitrospinota bacterium M3_3B_026]
MKEHKLSTAEWIKARLVCPVCLASGVVEERGPAGEGYGCPVCGRWYPVGQYGVVDFQAHDRLLALPEPYLGIWAAAQMASHEEYRTQSEGSVSTADREVAQAFSGFMDLDGKSVLDVGAGTDYLPGYVAEAAPAHYVALDPFPVERPIDYFKTQAWGEAIPFADGTFDTIILGTSLDHILCLDSFFSEARRVLKPDGTVYVWSAWVFDESLFANVPETPLFSRRDAKAPVGHDREEQLRIAQKCRQFISDTKTLTEQYTPLLVDQYHFRHLPINEAAALFQEAGFVVKDMTVWDTHPNFVNAFLKITLRDTPLAPPSGTAHIVSSRLFLKQELRQIRNIVEQVEFNVDRMLSGINRLESEARVIREIKDTSFMYKIRKLSKKLLGSESDG